MADGIKDNIHIRVSLVVQLVDDYTDQVITGNGVSIEVDGQKKPIKKSDGFFVFTNLNGGGVTLRVWSPLYQEEIRRVDLGQLDQKDRMLKLRLRPNRSYGLPKGTTCIEGKTEPGMEVYAYLPKSRGYSKLLFDTKKTLEDKVQQIKIYNPEGIDLEERYLMIINEESQKGELIRILRLLDGEHGTYQVIAPLKEDYKKIGTKLFLVYTTTADPKGKYFLPVKHGNKEELLCVIRTSSDKVKEKTVVLEEGRVNHIDIT